MATSHRPFTLGLLAASLALPLVLHASTVNMLDPGIPYRDNNYGGGEFRVQPVVGFSGVLDGDLIAGVAGFQTFCLETTEFFSTDAPFNNYGTVISDSAVFGGFTGGPSDPLDGRTAWLYEQFRAGTLAGYNFTPGAGRASTARDLQEAIWFIEGETNVGVNNSFVAAANAGALAAGYVILVSGDYVTVSLGNARVLQNWDAGFEGQVGHQHQDVLMLVPLPPAGWAGMTSLGGLMCFGYIRRRRLQRA